MIIFYHSSPRIATVFYALLDFFMAASLAKSYLCQVLAATPFICDKISKKI